MTSPTPLPVPDEAEDAAFRAAVEDGLADSRAGHVVAYDQVRSWLLTWGTEHELPPPACPSA